DGHAVFLEGRSVRFWQWSRDRPISLWRRCQSISLAYGTTVRRCDRCGDDHSWPRRDYGGVYLVSGGGPGLRDPRCSRGFYASVPHCDHSSSLLSKVCWQRTSESIRPGCHGGGSRRDRGSSCDSCKAIAC